VDDQVTQFDFARQVVPKLSTFLGAWTMRRYYSQHICRNVLVVPAAEVPETSTMHQIKV
jgi:hypothetical protein